MANVGAMRDDNGGSGESCTQQTFVCDDAVDLSTSVKAWRTAHPCADARPLPGTRAAWGVGPSRPSQPVGPPHGRRRTLPTPGTSAGLVPLRSRSGSADSWAPTQGWRRRMILRPRPRPVPRCPVSTLHRRNRQRAQRRRCRPVPVSRRTTLTPFQPNLGSPLEIRVRHHPRPRR